jgi:hypothetical protein
MFSEPRTVHIFRCSSNWKRYAATLERKGSNLPKDSCSGGNWLFVESHRVSDATTRGVADDEMRAALAEKGWHMWDTAAATRVVRPSGKVA